MTEQALLDLYSQRLKELGASIKQDAPLPPETAEASVRRRSPLCGSQVTFDVALDGEGRLDRIGWKARCCALAAASTGLVVAAGPGSTLAELQAMRDLLKRILRQRSPERPTGKWADMAVLAPAMDVPSRHGSALLAFETVVEAVAAALSKRASPSP